MYNIFIYISKVKQRTINKTFNERRVVTVKDLYKNVYLLRSNSSVTPVKLFYKKKKSTPYYY